MATDDCQSIKSVQKISLSIPFVTVTTDGLEVPRPLSKATCLRLLISYKDGRLRNPNRSLTCNKILDLVEFA